MHIRLSKCCLYACSFIAFLLVLISSAIAGETVYTLENGMTVILKESHGSPMVASMVFVESGSKYETKYENGITHFLEHLLFDGTANISREDLDRSIRDLGGYINAFTRQDMTAYLVLLPKQYIDYGMHVQVDMLFNSMIPDEELPKERKVVIEEINRDKDSPGYISNKFFSEKAYGNTLYNRPVLGYKAFIENIPREAIVTYWKTYYKPERMTLLVIGDFETEGMKKTVGELFGSLKNPAAPIISEEAQKQLAAPQNELPFQPVVFDTVGNVSNSYVNFSFNAPTYTDSSYYAFDLLAQYLSMEDISPLKKALTEGDTPLATEVSVSLLPYKEFSRLDVSVVAADGSDNQMIVETVDRVMRNIADHTADNEVLEGIKTSVMTDYIYNAEKLHYLGFIIGPTMMTCGWDFVTSYPDRLSQVSWVDCQKAASQWLDKPVYFATIVSPAAEGVTGYEPYEMPSEEVLTHFDSKSYDMPPEDSLRVALTYPATDAVSFELVDNAIYFDTTYSNGLNLIVKSRPDANIFALNVIGKNRSANEPDHQAGITDFVNRCLEKGTLTRNAAELSRDLAKIGANVTLYDNPWIPYDDRYTSRGFSFMKFETIDKFDRLGFHLFADMILHPLFDSADVEGVRRSMMGVLGRNSGSPREVARNQFYATLFDGQELAKTIMGSARTIGMITPADLKKHHRKFYGPGNMILSITTNRPVEEIVSWVEERFGRFVADQTEYISPTPPEPFFDIKEKHTDLEKEQVQIYLGGKFPGANDADAAGLKVAISILSNRLYLNLREKQGLAYSVGAGSGFDREFGWYYAVIGTQSDNYQKALDGIILHIEKLKLDGPTAEEVTTAKNQLWGRLMSAKLSSINQAYYLGLDKHLGRPLDYDSRFIQSLSQIDIETVRKVSAKYLRTDAYILATAGKK